MHHTKGHGLGVQQDHHQQQHHNHHKQQQQQGGQRPRDTCAVTDQWDGAEVWVSAYQALLPHTTTTTTTLGKPHTASVTWTTAAAAAAPSHTAAPKPANGHHSATTTTTPAAAAAAAGGGGGIRSMCRSSSAPPSGAGPIPQLPQPVAVAGAAAVRHGGPQTSQTAAGAGAAAVAVAGHLRLQGLTLPHKTPTTTTPTTAAATVDSFPIEVHEMWGLGRRLVLLVKPTTSFSRVMSAYAARRGVETHALGFYYNGVRLAEYHRPCDFDMEEGDVVQCFWEDKEGL